MIQRALLRQIKATSAARPSMPRSLSLHPLKQTGSSSFNLSRQRTCARWYATEPEVKKATDGEPDVAAAAEAEDPMKKELEAKTREITDLKVRDINLLREVEAGFWCTYGLTRCQTGQISSLSRRFPKPSRTDQT